MNEESATDRTPAAANHTCSAVLVPFDQREPLQALSLPMMDTTNLTTTTTRSRLEHDETIIRQCIISPTTTTTSPDNLISTLLLRPSETMPGLFAYHEPLPDNRSDAAAGGCGVQKNLRATRLAMACGLFAIRFHGNVVLIRATTTGLFSPLAVREVCAACEISPDLRPEIQRELMRDQMIPPPACMTSPPFVPYWLAEAAKSNYHDQSVLEKLASVFQANDNNHDKKSSTSSDNRSTAPSSSSDQHMSSCCTTVYSSGTIMNPKESRPFVKSLVPLCLHCRRPASTLCSACHGVYFCAPPRPCHKKGWSHDCLCDTYRLYTNRRTELSSTGLEWEKQVTGRAFQLSEEPYEKFLVDCLNITGKEQLQHSWWRTELDGWSGGMSESAQFVNVSIRKSYPQGFHPLHKGKLPPQKPISEKDRISSGLPTNEVGLLKLESWKDYYEMRGIPHDSIAALLLTFPLTMYHAIVLYGAVPCTVAQMLSRPLRIHVVGAEKELNFLDLFQEVLFLLPEDMMLELVFCVREDMLPPSIQVMSSAPVHLAVAEPRMRVVLVSGTYVESIDPNFDCGTTGAPDMIMAFNAGLYAYSSWRSVVQYLDQNPGVVGVFTDYNEFSGVQCASLGGSESRNSVRLNPFRQPRAMPVLSMSLPQFSNGFLYAFNEQSL